MPTLPIRQLQNLQMPTNTIIEDNNISINLNLSAIEDPDKNNPGNLYDFNPGNFNPDVSNVLYPSMTSIIGERSVIGNGNVNNTLVVNNPNYNFEFNNNFELNDVGGAKQNETINFDFNNQDFNFDK